MSRISVSGVEQVPLWSPTAAWRELTEMTRFMEWVGLRRGEPFADYDALWRWSVDDLDAFWSSIWDFFEVKAHAPYDAVLASRGLPGATWFAGARLNLAEHLLGIDGELDAVAAVAHSQTRPPVVLSFG